MFVPSHDARERPRANRPSLSKEEPPIDESLVDEAVSRGELPKLPPERPLTENASKKLSGALAEQYERGMSIMELAAAVQRSRRFVRGRLVESGVTIRPGGRGPHSDETESDLSSGALPKLPPHVRLTGTARKDLAARVAQRYKAGVTVPKLAAAIGRSEDLVYQLLAEAEVTLRVTGKGGPPIDERVVDIALSKGQLPKLPPHRPLTRNSRTKLAAAVAWHYERGVSPARLAVRMGRSDVFVRTLLREAESGGTLPAP